MARLPYNYDRPDGDTRAYRESDWRSTPRVQTNRDIERLVDEISMEAANEICKGADATLYQTFYFNMMSRNDFNNEDFRGLVQFICDVLEFKYAARTINRYTEGLQDHIIDMTMLHCSKQADTYPELLDEGYRLENERVNRSVQANIEHFFKLVDQLERMHSEDQRDVRRDDRDDRYRDSRDDRRDSRGYRSDRDRRDSRDDRDSRGYRGDRDRRDDRDYRGGFSRDRRDSRRDRDEEVVSGRETQAHKQVDTSRDAPRYAEDMFIPVDSRGNLAQQRDDNFRRSSEFFREEPRSQNMSTRESNYAPSPSPAPAAAQPQIYRSEPTQPCPPPPAGSHQQDFSADQLWNLQSPSNTTQATATPAVDPHQYGAPAEPDVVPTTVSTSVGEYNLVRFTNGESQMDALKHAAIYPEGSSTKAVDMVDEVKAVLTLEEAIISPAVHREQIEGSTETLESLDIFGSLGALAMHVSEEATNASIDRAGENSDGVRRIYHSFGVVDNAVIGFVHLNKLQEQIRQTTSLRDILALLRRTQESTNTHAPASAAFATDLRSAVVRFDRVITREINMFARHVLKISDGDVIKSAIQSYGELAAHIEQDTTRGAQERSSAFLAFVTQLNASIKEALNPKLGVEKTVLDANGIDTETRGVAMLPVTYLLTHLPFTMSELGLERQGSFVITEDKFSSFLKAALDVSKIDDADMQHPNRVLVTRDLEVFRIFSFPGRRNSLVLVPIEIN